MIDFRYHLVSLISVFLALAVGIILGAGPLQDAIGDQLQDQVDQLRSERNTLRGQLDAATARADDAEEFIAAAGPQLIRGTLPGHRVAIVVLDSADADRDKTLTEQFTASGATVVASVQLSSSWTAASAERDRKTVAGGLGDLVPGSSAETTPEQRLSEALVAALTQESTLVPGTLSDNAVQLGDQLEKFNLITVGQDQTVPADLILLVSGDTSAPASGATPTATTGPATGAVAIQMELAIAAQKSAKAVLVAGPTVGSGDLISAIRDDNTVNAVVSTVSGIQAEPGMISIPLAFAACLGGEVGQYGFDSGATAVIPPLPTATGTATPTPPSEG